MFPEKTGEFIDLMMCHKDVCLISGLNRYFIIHLLLTISVFLYIRINSTEWIKMKSLGRILGFHLVIYKEAFLLTMLK